MEVGVGENDNNSGQIKLTFGPPGSQGKVGDEVGAGRGIKRGRVDAEGNANGM